MLEVLSRTKYPATDRDGLMEAIRAAGRREDCGPFRAHVITRATDLNEKDLLPDAWGEDGSIEGLWTDEQRDSARDVFQALESMVDDEYPDRYCWVQDWYGNADDSWTVIYCYGGDLYSRPFTYDPTDQTYSFSGDPVPVRPVSSWVERKEERKEEEKKVMAPKTLALRKQRLPKRGEREVRKLALDSLEIRDSEDDTSTRLLVGYASLFNRRYSVGLYEEEIAPGAFKRSLNDPALDCVLRIEHEDLPLARTTNGTLRLIEDQDGLRVEADLNTEDPDVQRIIPKMERGDLTEMSFAFRCVDDTWTDDYGVRTVRQANIHRGDVSIVTYGASSTTFASLRSEQLEEACDLLRAAGPEAFIAAWTEWRDYTLLTVEKRAGATLSAATMNTLSSVLKLISNADDSLDEAQPLLADLMGVPNPDSYNDDEELGAVDDTEAREQETEVKVEEVRTPVPLVEARYDEWELEIRRLKEGK